MGERGVERLVCKQDLSERSHNALPHGCRSVDVLMCVLFMSVMIIIWCYFTINTKAMVQRIMGHTSQFPRRHVELSSLQENAWTCFFWFVYDEWKCPCQVTFDPGWSVTVISCLERSLTRLLENRVRYCVLDWHIRHTGLVLWYSDAVKRIIPWYYDKLHSIIGMFITTVLTGSAMILYCAFKWAATLHCFKMRCLSLDLLIVINKW